MLSFPPLRFGIRLGAIARIETAQARARGQTRAQKPARGTRAATLSSLRERASKRRRMYPQMPACKKQDLVLSQIRPRCPLPYRLIRDARNDLKASVALSSRWAKTGSFVAAAQSRVRGKAAVVGKGLASIVTSRQTNCSHRFPNILP
jgi:hypothetical protein